MGWGWDSSKSKLAESQDSIMPTESTITQMQNDRVKNVRRFSAVSGVEGPGVLDIAGNEEPEEEPPPNPLHNESSSVIKFYPEWCRCVECLRHTGSYTPDAPCLEHWQNALLCPPQGPSARIFAFILVFVLTWIFLWFLLIEAGVDCHSIKLNFMYSPAGPFGPIFALGLLEILGLFAGIVMKSIKLPSLLGPLILGIFMRNIDPINIFKNLEGFNCTFPIDQATRTINSGHWIKPIRQIALTMILTRAGLELSPKQLRKLKGVVPLLAFGPCIAEACTCALFTWLFFNYLAVPPDLKMGLPMCFVSGFALAAVSPAVVVPGMLSLKRKNLGVGQGVPTLLIAASSIDDVLAISAYSILLGVALTDTNAKGKHSNILEFIGGPLSIVVGVLVGLIVGIFLHFIPSRDNKNKAVTRLVLLLLFNMVAMFGFELYEPLAGAGSLAVLVASFIASFGWRSQAHWKIPMKKIGHSLSYLWTLCVPLLFGTIGREIDFKAKGFGGARLGKILAIIFICLFVRCCVAFTVVGIAKLNWKERLFCAFSWIPKATVQAALAPLVLSKIQDKHRVDLEDHGRVVVTTAVLAILITAPLGSILIAFFGPRLLQLLTAVENEILESEFPNGDGVEPEPETITYTPASHSQNQLYRANSGSVESVEAQGSPNRVPSGHGVNSEGVHSAGGSISSVIVSSSNPNVNK